MKIRTSFVANSSSSSFIVAFDQEINSANDICQVLFGGKDTVLYEYSDHDHLDELDIIGVDILSDYIFENMRDASDKALEDLMGARYWYMTVTAWPNMRDEGRWMGGGDFFGTDKEATEQIRVLYLQEEKKRNDYNAKKIKKMPSYQSFEKKRRPLIEKAVASDIAAFKKANKGKFIYTFHLSDNEGRVGSQAEHGGTFDKLPHISIGNH